MAGSTYRVTAESQNQTCVKVKARTFEIIIDEPESLGGTNLGANPVEYLLASLTGCLNVVGHMIAREMGFKIEELKISAKGSLNPAKLLGKPSEDRAGFLSISVEMKTKTTADQDTLDKWAQAVEKRCPISDNVSNATQVTIEPVKI